MVEVIYLEKSYPCEEVLGTYIDESHFDRLLTEDADVYKPISPFEVHSEKNVLLKFRKNVIPQEIQKNAYDALHQAAVLNNNRGMAAGPRGETNHNREWLQPYQERIMNLFLQAPKASGSFMGGLEDVYSQIRKELEVRETDAEDIRGIPWKESSVREHQFKFDEWVERTLKLSPEEQAEASLWVEETLLAKSSYAAEVRSGMAGYYGRYPRFPYCRTTAYTGGDSKRWGGAVPFIEEVSAWFERLLPSRYRAQKTLCEQMDPSFVVGNSAYTTVTINKNFRTACHRDAGDLKEGFGNLTVITNGKDYKGGYLILPEYRVAVDIRPGDVLMVDVGHEIHGNTEITSDNGDHERVSIVCYYREDMKECGSKVYEDARFNFVESRRKNPLHPEQRVRWNGVSPSMWESQEWYDYLSLNYGIEMLQKYHPEAFKEEGLF